MNSALYFGQVRHRRFAPKPHAFRYALFMVYLDLAELEHVFSGRWLWSTTGRRLAEFRRSDHFGDPALPLDVAVRDLVESETGRRPLGPVRLLTHLRYFGYVTNPICVYYCFDAADSRVEQVVLEVTNTPWGERHTYVLAPGRTSDLRMDAKFEKQLHVSPFMPMDCQYRCRMSTPARALTFHLENHREGACVFDATLTLRRKRITGFSLAFALAAFPWMTAKVIAAIYFEALRLWLKRVPYVPHPKHSPGKIPLEVRET